MQIPLQVGWFAGGLRIMAHFLIQCEHPHIFGSIRAIVDTGSPTTILGVMDLKRMRVSPIQLKNLETKKGTMAIEGGNLKTKLVKNAKISFSDIFKSEVLDVCAPFDSDDGGFCQVTILGVDFMEKNNLKLFFDPRGKSAYFEKDDGGDKE